MNLKKSLKMAMLNSGVSVLDIAALLCVSEQTIYKSVRSDARLSTIERIANCFNMKTSEFLALGEECNE